MYGCHSEAEELDFHACCPGLRANRAYWRRGPQCMPVLRTLGVERMRNVVRGAIPPAGKAGAFALRKILRRLPQSPILEFQPQRKLDLPLVIRQLSANLAPVRRFRERGMVNLITVEYCGVQAIAAEVCMVEDVEEFRPEFHHATLSHETPLCLL